MCLIAVAYLQHPLYRTVVLANRDEFYARPTAPAQWWEDQPSVLGGRDLEAGGTWMGIHRNGRWAALTNFREPQNIQPDAPSRGDLVSNFLLSSDRTSDHLQHIAPEIHAYNGFNMLVDDGVQPGYISNRASAIQLLSPGIYGLSNHLLDTPWPKVSRLKEALHKLCREGKRLQSTELFEILYNGEKARDELLPDTGVGIEWERLLSPLFIKSETYGTRVSTAMFISHQGEVFFAEKEWRTGKEREFQFEIKKMPSDLSQAS